MMAGLWRAALFGAFCLLVTPALAQFTLLDQAQDAARPAAAPAAEPGKPLAPPPPCGRQALSIARMSWPSAELLAEIHARILAHEYGCEIRVTPGDLAATGLVQTGSRVSYRLLIAGKPNAVAAFDQSVQNAIDTDKTIFDSFGYGY